MAPTNVNFAFDPTEVLEVGDHRIFIRQNWADAWVQLNGLYCSQAAWSIAPSIPTATLEWLYGEVLQVGNANFQTETKTTATDLVDWYVKIDFDVRRNAGGVWQTRTWYGVVGSAEDKQGGVNAANIATGDVVLHCFGLEKLLADHVVNTALVDGPPNFTVDVAIDFNVQRGKRGLYPNRSTNKFGASFLFANDAPAAESWSSRSIVDYLLARQTPVDRLGVKRVPFTLSAPVGAPPSWDEPRLHSDNASTYELLNQVIDRRRMMVWWVEVVGQVVQVKVDTLTAQEIVNDLNLPAAENLPANANQRNILADKDPLTNIALNNSNLPLVQRVVTRGPLMRSVGSWSYTDNNLGPAWSGSLETEYETAASADVRGSPNGYASQGTKEKQRRNQEFRASPRLADVFVRHLIDSSFDWQVADGEGGAMAPLFLDEAGGLQKQCWSETFIDRTMPLLKGVDYGGSKIADDTVDLADVVEKQELPPLVVFKRPDKADANTAERWIKADQMGRQANLERSGGQRAKQNERFSVYVTVEPLGHSVSIRVSGQHQHALANSTFTRLTVDEFLGEWDYTNGMIVTLSMTGNFHAEAHWPELLPAGDVVREKVINAGEQFTKDYVAPNTVVDVDENGELVRSTGGHIPKVSDSDNVAKLKQIAKVAWNWYGVTHRVMQLDSNRLMLASELNVGDLVINAGDNPGHQQEINSIISQITFSQPRGRDGGASPPVMQVTTWAGELDVMPPTPRLAGQVKKEAADAPNGGPAPFTLVPANRGISGFLGSDEFGNPQP